MVGQSCGLQSKIMIPAVPQEFPQKNRQDELDRIFTNANPVGVYRYKYYFESRFK